MFDGIPQADEWQSARPVTLGRRPWELVALVLTLAGVFILAATLAPDALTVPMDRF